MGLRASHALITVHTFDECNTKIMIEMNTQPCSNEPFCSDNEEFADNVVNTKRYKMTEEERLTRCRERNRLHAKSTRERKKSHMDCLESRIEELVDEKKRLNCTASETSVASILMSLSNMEKHPGSDGIDFNFCSKSDEVKIASTRIESDDDTSESIEKLKSQMSSFLNHSKSHDVIDSSLDASRDKSVCSPTELEGIRREKNRMHAKQTRLRKKKMTLEMEGIISTLEKEVGDLQNGLISMLPEPISYNQTHQSNSIKNEFVKYIQSKERDSNGLKLSNSSSNLIETSEQSGDANLAETSASSKITSTCENFPTSVFNRKRKQSSSAVDANEPNYTLSQHQSDNSGKGQEDRDTKLMWRQHISKNTAKTVSICSESTGSVSEGSGSGSEGGLGPGSAVHNLLHIGGTSSSHSRGSSSGSDDDSSSSNPTEIAVPVPGRTTTVPRAADARSFDPRAPSTLPLYSYPGERPKCLQAILAACGPPLVAVSQKQAHWRVPDRGYAFSSHSLAGPTAAAVASIYPTISIENSNDSGPFRGYIPMRGGLIESNRALANAPCHGMRNQDFTIYDGHRLRAMKDQ